METKNTYEAAFYIMFGAFLKEIKIRKIAENKQIKKGYRRECILVIDNVQKWTKNAWENGYIYGDLVEFSRIREKIKKLMRRVLKEGRGIGFRA
jgi:hypothetical protein